MRDYAKVSPRIWTGRLGKSLRGNEPAQVLAMYLVTCPHANMIGLYHLPMEYICADTGLSKRRVDSAFKALARGLGGKPFALYDAENERVWVVEHARHEMNGRNELSPRDNRIKGIADALRDHAISPLARAFADHYPEMYELAGRPLDDNAEGPSKGVPKPLLMQEQEQEQEQEVEASEDLGFCAEPDEPAPAPQPVLEFPCVGNRAWPLYPAKLEEYRESFPGIDVLAECRRARQWLLDNPKRRKTYDGMARYLGNWLGKEQNRGGRRPEAAGAKRSSSAIPARRGEGPAVATHQWPKGYEQEG